MWETGSFEINGVKFLYEAKVFEEGSKFGMGGGRISKLYICRDIGRTTLFNDYIVHYDRGWDIRPRTELAWKAVRYVKKLYE